MVERLATTGQIVLPLRELNLRQQEFLGICGREYSKRLTTVFSAQQGQFDAATVEVEVVGAFQSEPANKRSIRFGSGQGSLEAVADNESLAVSLTLSEDTEKPPVFVLQDMLGYILADFTLGASLPSPFVLSAERLGIALFYKELDIAKNVLVEALQKMAGKADKNNGLRVDPFEIIDEFSSRYAMPVKDNIDFTRDISNAQKRTSPLLAQHALPDRIKEMMGGYFRQSGNDIQFVSKARKERRFEIPLFLASSSARAVSDLYFYLRHKAVPGELLMIDEPESHLSPANQVALARLLALCVHAGLRVYMTTHSDYIVKEFNNLLLLGNDFPGKANFLATNKEYVAEMGLQPGQVAAYVSRQGGLFECPVTKRGMTVASFDDTINRMNRLGDDLSFLVDSGEVR
jgi:hypothetical protein